MMMAIFTGYINRITEVTHIDEQDEHLLFQFRDGTHSKFEISPEALDRFRIILRQASTTNLSFRFSVYPSQRIGKVESIYN